MTMSGAAASASSSSATDSTSTSIGLPVPARLAAVTAASSEPAAAMWFSLMSTMSYRPIRWLCAPPQRTAYFCAVRSPGTVLRVSRIVHPVPATASTKRRATVAVADSSCRKFSAVRSPVSTARAGPAISKTTWLAARRSPSSACQVSRTRASRRRKVSSAHVRPHRIASSRVMTLPRTLCPAGTSAAVTSPLPMSSRSAASTCCARSAGVCSATMDERQSEALPRHTHEHGDRQHEVDARGHARRLARACLLLIRRGDDAEDLFLIWPDHPPDVEEHDRAEPCANADDHESGAEREGVEEVLPEQPRTAEPGRQRRPAEPEQRPRGDVFGDAGAAGTALVRRGIRQRGRLGDVEVVQEADPEHTRDDVEPARQARAADG